jgi:hypothetical protein
MKTKRLKIIITVLAVSIIVILFNISCKEVDESQKADDNYSNYVDTFSPSVSTTVPFDRATFVTLNSEVRITFNEQMDVSSMTANQANSVCSGTIQISKNNFVSCILMGGEPITSDKKTFSVAPSIYLENATNYKIKISSDARDTGSNNLESNKIITFSTHSQEIIKDYSTNLFWENYATTTYIYGRSGAISYCENLNVEGRKDWRLPNMNELKVLYTNRSILRYYSEDRYWTTGLSSWWDSACMVDFSNGDAHCSWRMDMSIPVRCVSSGQ